MHPLFIFAVVQYNVKTPRHRDDQLVQFLVRMSPALGAAGYVVQVVDALDIERDMLPSFDERQISSGVMNYWKVDSPAKIN